MCVWMVARLPQRLKSKFFEKILNEGAFEVNLEKTLILAFEVIVQPPKHTFEIALFSNFMHTILWNPENVQFRESLNWLFQRLKLMFVLDGVKFFFLQKLLILFYYNTYWTIFSIFGALWASFAEFDSKASGVVYFSRKWKMHWEIFF